MPVNQYSLPIGPDREPAPARTRRLQSFVGVKCPQPIRHPERWERDVLIMLSLDPHVARIEQVDDCSPKGVLFSVGITTREGGPVILRIVDEGMTDLRAGPPPGVAVMGRDAILRSPGLEARRAIWASREAAVSATNRYWVALALADSADGLSLREVIGLVDGRAREVVDTVCALACEDTLWIDVSGGLTPEAIVRRTPRPVTAPDDRVMMAGG
jgi:hypothetical protein